MAKKLLDNPYKGARSEKKWTDIVMKQGFIIVPSMLFVGQKRLNITPNEFNVLLQIISFWWDEDRYPYPSRQKIADRMGVSVKTVQRTLASLEERKLLKRMTRSDPRLGRVSNSYDLSGLVEALKPLAMEQRTLTTKRLRLDGSRRSR